MAKKQKSFAEKASSKGAKDLVHVKFVKSVPSERDGFWRFNESMISMEKGQNLDAKLKEIEDEAKLVDIDMPSENDEQKDSEALESSSTLEAPSDSPGADSPQPTIPFSSILTKRFSEFDLTPLLISNGNLLLRITLKKSIFIKVKFKTYIILKIYIYGIVGV